MYRIILTFLIVLVTLALLEGHLNFFWHQKDIVVVDDKDVSHDLGPGRFFFGFEAADVYVRTDQGDFHSYRGYRRLVLDQTEAPASKPIDQ